MFAGAGVVGLPRCSSCFCSRSSYGLVAAGLPVWLSFLIVAVVLFVVAGVLALVGKKAVNKVKGKPERTIVTTQETIAALKPKPTDTPPRPGSGTTADRATDASSVLIDGPWEHRFVAGQRRPLPRRRAGRGPARAPAARLPAVLVGLARTR